MSATLINNGKNIINTDDFTIKLYLECYNNKSIDIEEMKYMDKLFSMLKDHELEDSQYVDYDGFIRNGIKIIAKEKEYKAINLETLNNDIDKNMDKEDIYFVKSLSTLVSNMPYISTDDRICLNSLFEGMIEFNQGIGEIRNINGNIYLPKYNYKTKTLK